MGYPLISKVCDEMRNFHYEGNIVPISWCRKLKKIVWDREAHEYKESDQTDHLAILILSDILYWYKPVEIRDEKTGKLVGYGQRFEGDKLQKTYQEYAELLNAPKSSVKRAIDNLVFRGLVRREFRTIKTRNGLAMCNVMYLEPVLEEIKKIT